MKENSRGIYDHFPMQAALGLYSLHRFAEEEEERETSSRSHRRKERTDQCASKETTSAMTKDTKP